MYGPVIFLLCARPGDDLIGTGAAILRARDQGCVVSSYMLSTGMVPKPRWQFWQRNRASENVENLMNTSRRMATDYGHQFVGWNTANGAGYIATHINQVARDIERAFVSIKPDVVWAPAFLGLDPDYDALNVIASRLPQLSSDPVDVYEYIPRPLQRTNLGAGSGRTHMVFPTRLGMELMLNLTASEGAKRIRHLDALRAVYDEPLPSDSDRELFRLLPEHNYAKPPYGYKNALMIRGRPVGAATANAVVPQFLRLKQTPVSRASALAMQGDVSLHHLPQG